MVRRPITCPECGTYQEVELDATPAGLVVADCTRFATEPGVACERECARRLDRKARAASDDTVERVLVVIDDADATLRIARLLAEILQHDQLHIEVARAAARPPPPADYDFVALGGTPHLGRLARSILDYAREHAAALNQLPTAFFGIRTRTVGMRGWLAHVTGWVPRFAVQLGEIVERAELAQFARAIADEIEPTAHAPAVEP